MSEWERNKNQHDYTEQDRIEVVRMYKSGKYSYDDIKTLKGASKDSVKRWSKKYDHLADLEDGYLPEGHGVKGTSTLYDDKGKIKMQWVKTNQDAERTIELIQHAVEGMKDEVPRQAPIAPPKHVDEDLMSAYIITDYHFGQMASEREVGEKWDMEVAETLLINWFKSAISSAPNSHTGVLCQLGDFLHWDGLEAMTPTSGHPLDASERFGPLVQTIIRVLRQVVDMLLQKHERVHILMAEGNHDLASSIWMRMLFGEKYANDPRVTVDESHVPFYAYEWGETSVFFHHGHKARIGQISEIMTSTFRELWGKTKYSYAHMGHYHHIDVKETRCMVVEQHPTLASKDAHSARGGYVSQRSASVITYSKKYGEVGRQTIRPEMVM